MGMLVTILLSSEANAKFHQERDCMRMDFADQEETNQFQILPQNHHPSKGTNLHSYLF